MGKKVVKDKITYTPQLLNSLFDKQIDSQLHPSIAKRQFHILNTNQIILINKFIMNLFLFESMMTPLISFLTTGLLIK